MPAKAGIQNHLKSLDSRFRGNDRLLAHICLRGEIFRHSRQAGIQIYPSSLNYCS